MIWHLPKGRALPAAEAIELEIEIATADFECQISTLLPVEQEIESQIVDKLIEEFPEYRP